MALGDVANNNNQKGKYQPQVYSGYGFSNSESNVDKTKLSCSFWNKMLKLSIVPLKGVNSAGIPEWDEDNAVSMYLTHVKARILHDEIDLFMNNRDSYNNLGVPSGSGLVSISSGKELGTSNPCLIIRKLNAETGAIDSSYAYEFKQDYHYSVRNFDESTSDFDKIYHNDTELEQLKTLLKSYYEAMTGAMAYSIIDNMKYDTSRLNTKINSIAEKLGIEYGQGGSYNKQKSSTSIFNNKEGRNFTTSTIDDIESQFE